MLVFAVVRRSFRLAGDRRVCTGQTDPSLIGDQVSPELRAASSDAAWDIDHC